MRKLSPVCELKAGLVRKSVCRTNTGEKFISRYTRYCGATGRARVALRVEVCGFMGNGGWKSAPTPRRVFRRWVYVTRERPFESALALAVRLRDLAVSQFLTGVN